MEQTVRSGLPPELVITEKDEALDRKVVLNHAEQICSSAAAGIMKHDSSPPVINRPTATSPARRKGRVSDRSAVVSREEKNSRSAQKIWIALSIITICGLVSGGGYYWFEQVSAEREQAALALKAENDERQRKLAEATRRAEDERLRMSVEAEARAKAEALKNLAEEAARIAALDIVERANQCQGISACKEAMLAAAWPLNSEALRPAIERIRQSEMAPRGNRKAARALNENALTAMNANNNNEAIKMLRQAVIEDPADVEIWSNLGFIALRADDFDLATDALERAIQLDPQRTSTWIPLAEALLMKGSLESSVRALLLGYAFSANKEKTVIFLEEKSVSAERYGMRSAYADALVRIKNSADK